MERQLLSQEEQKENNLNLLTTPPKHPKEPPTSHFSNFLIQLYNKIVSPDSSLKHQNICDPNPLQLVKIHKDNTNIINNGRVVEISEEISYNSSNLKKS